MSAVYEEITPDPGHIEIRLTPEQLRVLADMGVAIIIVRADAVRWESE